MKFVFAVTNRIRSVTPVWKDCKDLAAAKKEAENLLAPEGVIEVEIFQKVENGRISKQTTTSWSS